MTLKLRNLAVTALPCVQMGYQGLASAVRGIGKYWSTGCSPIYTHWLAVAGCTPPPQGWAPVFSCIFDSFQSMKLVHLPQTLTLHLKRFCFERSSRTHKLSHSLPFPQELDLRQVLTESQCQAEDSEKVRYSCSQRADFLLSASFS